MTVIQASALYYDVIKLLPLVALPAKLIWLRHCSNVYCYSRMRANQFTAPTDSVISSYGISAKEICVCQVVVDYMLDHLLEVRVIAWLVKCLQQCAKQRDTHYLLETLQPEIKPHLQL